MSTEINRGRKGECRNNRGDNPNSQSKKNISLSNITPAFCKPGCLQHRFNSGISYNRTTHTKCQSIYSIKDISSCKVSVDIVKTTLYHPYVLGGGVKKPKGD